MTSVDTFTSEQWAGLGAYLDSLKTIEQLVREQYPQLTWVLNNPELGPIIKQAAREHWDTARLQGALQKTAWWQKTDNAQREWQRIWAEDPATGQTMLDKAAINVMSTASTLGVRLAGNALNQIAANAAAEGWDQLRVTQEIMKNATFDPKGTGDVNGMVNQIKDRSAEYLMPMSDQTAFGWAKNILTGAASKDGLDSYFRQQAINRFSGDQTIVDALKQGATVKEIFDPYVQQTAQLLELGPEMINLMDRQYSTMIDSRGPDGERRPMTLAEAADYIRGTDQWKATDQAGEAAAGFAEQLLKTFGEVA